MTFGYAIIYNGEYYPAGAEIEVTGELVLKTELKPPKNTVGGDENDGGRD